MLLESAYCLNINMSLCSSSSNSTLENIFLVDPALISVGEGWNESKSLSIYYKMSISDFEVLSKLGDGAYSTVYKVKRVNDGMIYALKKVKMQNLNKKEKKNALNEVRILASIEHPNIISYKEAFFDESGNLCLVMEYADNGDLYQKITKYQKRGKYMSEKFIWNIFSQITQGLKALHDLNVLHRDMKSANVFLNINGTTKLGDMNVSKVAKNGLLYTQTGTPYYASPEVWLDKPYNIKSDIWSLGCVLYETATLKPPFRAEDMQGLYEKVVKGEYSPIQPHYSKDIRHLIRQLLQIDPAKRPNCDEILSMPAFQRHVVTISHKSEPNTLLSSINFSKDQDSMSEDFPRPKYNIRHKSEVPSLKNSPSKASKTSKWNGNKSFAVNDFSYKPNAHYKEIVKEESYGVIKLPKVKYPSYQSPQPIRKLKDIEEYYNLPKNLPANDRLKKLRDAYLSRPLKPFII